MNKLFLFKICVLLLSHAIGLTSSIFAAALSVDYSTSAHAEVNADSHQLYFNDLLVTGSDSGVNSSSHVDIESWTDIYYPGDFLPDIIPYQTVMEARLDSYLAQSVDGINISSRLNFIGGDDVIASSASGQTLLNGILNINPSVSSPAGLQLQLGININLSQYRPFLVFTNNHDWHFKIWDDNPLLPLFEVGLNDFPADNTRNFEQYLHSLFFTFDVVSGQTLHLEYFHSAEMVAVDVALADHQIQATMFVIPEPVSFLIISIGGTLLMNRKR